MNIHYINNITTWIPWNTKAKTKNASWILVLWAQISIAYRYLQNRKGKKWKVNCVRLTLQKAIVIGEATAQSTVCTWKFLWLELFITAIPARTEPVFVTQLFFLSILTNLYRLPQCKKKETEFLLSSISSFWERILIFPFLFTIDKKFEGVNTPLHIWKRSVLLL